jgi:asparagine synthase (glutamine-hydrolysing)
MSYADNRFWIIFNGELYNYQDIKNELQKIGYQFISKTDTEVVLAAYAEWGDECLNRFVGMWAFAIYDLTLNEIFLARDRYGIKPLYYWFSPEGSFCFASEIKQFTVCRGWLAKLNPQRAYDYLGYSFTDHTDETMFAGVYQLPSGSCFRSSIGKISPDSSGRISYRKWYLLYREPFKGSFKEAAEIFKKLFERSVKEHLNADVTVGTALSGGLDSSSIV